MSELIRKLQDMKASPQVIALVTKAEEKNLQQRQIDSAAGAIYGMKLAKETLNVTGIMDHFKAELERLQQRHSDLIKKL